MKALNLLLILSAILGSFGANGQLNQVYPEVYAIDGVPGYTTYRIYAEMNGPSHFISSVFGEGENPLFIGGSSNEIWNSSMGQIQGDQLTVAFCSFVPDLCFDSYVTVGMHGQEHFNGTPLCGQVAHVSTFPSTTAIHESFYNEIGENLNLLEGAWFVPGNVECDDNGYGAAPDFKILLSQVTIPSEDQLEYVINIQVFMNGDANQSILYMGAPNTLGPMDVDGSELGLSWPMECVDEDDDGVCDSMEVTGCTFVGACNYDSAATEDDATCFFATSVYDCEGNCQEDTDGDGICDQNEGQNGEEFCGDGTVWDPLTQTCIGYNECPADLNNDYIIDTTDLLVFLISFGTACD